MQILYGIAFLAIFVLCAALFMTTRRILRPSPLPSGQLDISSAYPVASSEEEPAAATHYQNAAEADPSIPAELEAVEEPAAIAAPPYSASISASENVPAKTVLGQPIPTAPMADRIATPAETAAAMEIDAQQPRQRAAKPSRRNYKRALECLLVGVSAFVLIQTQRNARFRMAHTVGSHVA